MTSTVKIPEGWIETTLGEIMNIFSGKARPKQGGEFPVYGGNGILDYADDYNFEGENIIVGRVGAYCGATYFETNRFRLSDNALGIKSNEKSDIKYLYYHLLNRKLNRHSIGGAQPLLTQGILNGLNILLPSLPEQKAIARVLSSFDDKIELLRAENHTLEEMGQTLFKEWFGKYKVEDELPDGWKWGELGEIGDQITERVKHEKERVVLSAVNSGNLVLSESYFSKQVFSEDIAKYIICNKGDFAYNPARINIGSIGRNFYWNGAVSPVYVVFRPKEKFGKYLEYIFKSERFKNHVEKYANGSVRQALNYDGFSRFELLIPNNDILEKFNENLEVFEKKIEENKKQTETLSNTRDQLLPKLMSGEVRV